jgi:hypothetical protein
MSIPRRSLLWVFAVAGAAFQCRRAFAGSRDAGPAQLARPVQSGESVRAIGRAYLRTEPLEAQRESLEKLLRERLSTEKGDVATRFAKARGRDFLEGRTVHLDGWILSRTEARLCALVTLA